jgi:8-oxo-dGTP diphosphatase
LVRRTDTGQWALPGGTLDWGERLREAVERELAEEAGTEIIELGALSGVYSGPHRDARFHAVTIVVYATVRAPARPPSNPLEIAEVGLFSDSQLPSRLAHGMTQMLADARDGRQTWE